MKKYLFDTNSLSRNVLTAAKDRKDFFVLQDVVEEWASTDEEYRRVNSSGIKVLALNDRHLEKLKNVMSSHGSNFDLIRLFTSEGTADVLMLAYAISEIEAGGMFPDDWIFVTEDGPLKEVARSYGISSLAVSAIPIHA